MVNLGTIDAIAEETTPLRTGKGAPGLSLLWMVGIHGTVNAGGIAVYGSYTRTGDDWEVVNTLTATNTSLTSEKPFERIKAVGNGSFAGSVEVYYNESD